MDETFLYKYKSILIISILPYSPENMSVDKMSLFSNLYIDAILNESYMDLLLQTFMNELFIPHEEDYKYKEDYDYVVKQYNNSFINVLNSPLITVDILTDVLEFTKDNESFPDRGNKRTKIFKRLTYLTNDENTAEIQFTQMKKNLEDLINIINTDLQGSDSFNEIDNLEVYNPRGEQIPSLQFYKGNFKFLYYLFENGYLNVDTKNTLLLYPLFDGNYTHLMNMLIKSYLNKSKTIKNPLKLLKILSSTSIKYAINIPVLLEQLNSIGIENKKVLKVISIDYLIERGYQPDYAEAK